MRKLIIVVIVMLTVAAGACGGESSSPDVVAGDGVRGQEVFGQVAAPACTTCHALDAGVILVGPSLAGVGARAGAQVEGLSAEEYLAQSIREPDAFLVEGYGSGLMTSTYGAQFTDQQVADLVAYMMTLR
jgi:cytochrome c2